MRRQILSLWSLSLLIACECRQYHYQKPYTPFVSQGAALQSYGPPPAAAATPAVANLPVLTAVVRTLGPAGKAYEVRLSNAKKIYEERQTSVGALQLPPSAAASGVYGPPTQAATPYASAGTYAGAANQLNFAGAGAYGAPAAGVNAANANIGYAGGAGGHFAGGHNAAASYYNSNIQYSPNQNPLLQSQYVVQPPLANAGGNSYGAQSAAQFSVQSYGGVQGGATNLAGQLGAAGDYVAQSEVGQLDHYPAKQQPIGETRAYTRLITTCYANGQCQQQQLGPGQADPQHQHIVLSARAQVAPISDKCRVLAEQQAAATAAASYGSVNAAANAPANLPNDPNYAGGSYYKQGPKRPKDRRLYAYTETVIAKDPFN